MDDGGPLVAILDPKEEAIALGFGRSASGYYVFDCEGRPVAEECQSIEEVISLCNTKSRFQIIEQCICTRTSGLMIS